MKNFPHTPRSRVVLRYTRDAVRDRALDVFPWSKAVSAAYLAAVQPEDRTLRFREDGETAEEAIKAQKHNWQLVDRLIKGASREFHADLEEFWVDQLPEPYRADCRAELTRRYGFIAAKLLSSPPAIVAEGLPALARGFADTMAAMAPILADNVINEDDRPFVRRALQEGSNLLAAWVAMQQQLVRLLPDSEVHGAAVAPAAGGPDA